MPDVRQRRLLWHCRRGMKELDELLSGFARQRFPAASSAQQAAFEALLALPDPQIADYLLGHGTPPDELAAVVRSVLGQ
ncbi:MAG TPA: succinate dehydrogenase assembly factor 2 [Steroidobacteraceae bacterium]|nr:succinate dehydrogenase assembly factor 2 [Steroidobacteraceae bacterium]